MTAFDAYGVMSIFVLAATFLICVISESRLAQRVAFIFAALWFAPIVLRTWIAVIAS